MKLSGIHIYPVKSTQGHDLRHAIVEPWGLAGDRRYLVTGPDGAMITARTHPKLLTCRAELDGDRLTLTAPGARPLVVVPSQATRPVSVWDDPVELRDCGDDAAAWLTALLDAPARLMWLDDPTRRQVDQRYGRPDETVSLADGYPLLLATTASLARLNDWVAETAAERGEESPEPLVMRRFRPSLVIDGAQAAFAEDDWKRVRVGEVEFRVTKGAIAAFSPRSTRTLSPRARSPFARCPGIASGMGRCGSVST